MEFEKFLLLSAILFCIGLYGALGRRNAITVLMSLEIMFIALILTAVAISRYVATQALTSDLANPSEATMQTLLTGQTFALFIIVVAAAEIALGLAIVIAFYRSKETIDISQANSMSE